MLDFTLRTFIKLLGSLKKENYHFQTLQEFITDPAPRNIVLRHDVDLKPQNALQTAKIEHGLGLKGTYYFRAIKESWDERIIKAISGMGHEIGYHYEEMSSHKGDHVKAIMAFKQNLDKLRKLAPVTTITMHGSPRSKHDPKDLWKHYDYREYDIIAEPYFDVDFSKILYLTDTGRKWDGYMVSIRDRVDTTMNDQLSEKGYRIHSTNDLIRAAEEDALPDSVMINFHPQRWNNEAYPWVKELVSQNAKNVVKRMLRQIRS